MFADELGGGMLRGRPRDDKYVAIPSQCPKTGCPNMIGIAFNFYAWHSCLECNLCLTARSLQKGVNSHLLVAETSGEIVLADLIGSDT
jgi:hypothetical protein